MATRKFRSQFTTAFHAWAGTRHLSVVLPSEVCKQGQCAAWHHENGMTTVRVWDTDDSRVEDITMPGHHVLTLIGGAK